MIMCLPKLYGGLKNYKTEKSDACWQLVTKSLALNICCTLSMQCIDVLYTSIQFTPKCYVMFVNADA